MPPIPTSPHHPGTPPHQVTTLQGMEAYTMQAKRDAGSRHTSRNIGGRVTHPAKEKKPPQATEGGQCAIGMQAATPMSDRVVTSHTHTDIATSPRHIELSPCKVWKQWSGAGCSRPHSGTSGRPDTPRHHHIELPPCKVWKQWSGAGMQPPSIWYQSHPPRHRHITPAHHHTGQSPCKVWKLTRCRRNGMQGAATRHEISGAG